MKLVLLVRTDLGMTCGKISAQVAHAAVLAALDAAGTAAGNRWLDEGQPKVVLRAADEAELLELADAARARRLPVHLVSDAGRTQVAAGTPTCCAIGPATDAAVDAVTGALRLL